MLLLALEMDTMSVLELLVTGASPGFGRGGQEIIFSDLECALLGGFGGMPPPPEKIFKIVQFVAFWCIFGSDFVFKKFQFLYKKI